jgi:hypothetical protein
VVEEATLKMDFLIEPAWILPWWLWMLIGGGLWYWKKGATSKGGKGLKFAGVIIVLVSFLALLFAAIGGDLGPGDRLENRPLDFDYIIALDSGIYEFTAFSSDGDEADATQMDVDDNTKTVVLDVVIDDSANTITPDSWGLTITVRRIDAGWTEAGTYVQATFMAKQSNAEFPKVLNNNSLAQDIVAKDTNFVYQVAWEDFADQADIGDTNGGALGQLNPGGSDSFTWCAYIWEADLQSNIPAQVITWGTDIVMSAEAIGESAEGSWSDSFAFTALFTFQL